MDDLTKYELDMVKERSVPVKIDQSDISGQAAEEQYRPFRHKTFAERLAEYNGEIHATEYDWEIK